MAGVEIQLIPVEEFRRVEGSNLPSHAKYKLLADMCRANAFAIVKRAGSGHLGSSLSSMDIITRLYWAELNLDKVGLDDPGRDIYFSSKGHDVPALYSVLYAKGWLAEDKLVNLRRISGLEGHPDISTPGIEANSGSLGMGISKGRGMAWAKKHLGAGGFVYVMTGDGELQEGQNYEGLQGSVHAGLDHLIVIVDHNKVQSDKEIHAVTDLANLVEKFSAFGWHVQRCDGNDQEAVGKALEAARSSAGKPSIIIADTIKGKGISFMEHTVSMRKGLYPWHAGAPGDADFLRGHTEIIERINAALAEAGRAEIALKMIAPPPAHDVVYSLQGEPVSLAMPLPTVSKEQSTFVAQAYGDAVLKAAQERSDVVVLDADLAADCRVRTVEDQLPEKFLECGIAEQDMVSVAGGLARMGLLPVVNSFASFLASRANEQIYNNATEKTKIVYACHYAGLIPAGPGKSHQSLRDIALLSSLPNIVIVHPGGQADAEAMVNFALGETEDNVAIRLAIGPSPREITPPDGYIFRQGQGYALTEGDDVLLIGYGPVLLHEALIAADILSSRNICMKLVNLPWLNRFDKDWFVELIDGYSTICVLDDHMTTGGLGDLLLSFLVESGLLGNRQYEKFGVDRYPAFGTPPEALATHRLDGSGIANRVLEIQR